MKTKIILLSILAWAITTGVHAQEPIKPTQDPVIQQQRAAQLAERSGDASGKLAKDLGLDEQQAARMKQIDQEYASAMNELRASGDRERIRLEGAELRERRDQQLKELLTPEQFEKLGSVRDDADEQRHTPQPLSE
jgi:Spy/CpxP family protein refolding chaperone